MDTVKTRILSDAGLCINFDRCVNLFQDFIEQRNLQEAQDVTISAVGTDTAGASYDGITADMTVADRYYTGDEYAALGKAKQKGLQAKRAKRGHKPGDKRSTLTSAAAKGAAKGSGTNQNVTLSNRSIKALASAMKTADAAETSDEDLEVEMAPPSKKGKTLNNRNNPALKKN